MAERPPQKPTGFGAVPLDTAIGGPRAAFPTTPSAVLGVQSDDPVSRGRAFQALVMAYWKPVYKCVRLKWRKTNEEAKDLTQGFFARAFEKRVFETYDPSKARFRTFVRRCLSNFVANQQEAQRRIKRGGAAIVLSLDYEEAEQEIAGSDPPGDNSFEAQFDREWVRSLHALAIASLRESLDASGKSDYFKLFARYDLAEDPSDKPTYDALAAELGIKATDVTNHLAFVRKEFRKIILEKLRQLTATEDEFRSEARELLGIEVV